MTRQEVLLAIMGCANGFALSPVQLQKAVFLVDRNLTQVFNENSRFKFEPYDYGPFDREVYVEAGKLELFGLTVSTRGYSGYKEYSVSPAGLIKSKEILDSLPDNQRAYILQVVEWVRSLSFAKLVKSIYEAYPDMRVNSIFQG